MMFYFNFKERVYTIRKAGNIKAKITRLLLASYIELNLFLFLKRYGIFWPQKYYHNFVIIRFSITKLFYQCRIMVPSINRNKLFLYILIGEIGHFCV